MLHQVRRASGCEDRVWWWWWGCLSVGGVDGGGYREEGGGGMGKGRLPGGAQPASQGSKLTPRTRPVTQPLSLPSLSLSTAADAAATVDITHSHRPARHRRYQPRPSTTLLEIHHQESIYLY